MNLHFHVPNPHNRSQNVTEYFLIVIYAGCDYQQCMYLNTEEIAKFKTSVVIWLAIQTASSQSFIQNPTFYDNLPAIFDTNCDLSLCGHSYDISLLSGKTSGTYRLRQTKRSLEFVE